MTVVFACFRSSALCVRIRPVPPLHCFLCHIPPPPKLRTDKPGVALREHHLTAFNLIAAETSGCFAMRANDGWLACDRDPQIWTVRGIDGFLERNKPCALWISAPNGEVPLCRRAQTIVGARLTDRTSHSYFVGYRHESLDLKVLR